MRSYEVIKRGIDIAGAVAGLLLALPIMLTAALAIKLDSPGPVLYRQTRLGKNGRPFGMLKLRSMVDGAHAHRAVLAAESAMDGPILKIRCDPRMTRVGRWLRKASVDELPQLWHVLCGEMSLVGPRPAIPEEVARYEPWQRERLAVKPGLTCTWQVSGRSDIPFEEWVRLDIAYIHRRSLWLDLKLLLLTIPAVLTARGAY
ncbi:MAG: sugar transferase [candidate division WS1 bacterium]|jgi:lipopolysaccharide/colanic/teichoic acid biosynthesis glycosyltransferase|nr:sugar transferase [candidate division WS1 bacterium]